MRSVCILKGLVPGYSAFQQKNAFFLDRDGVINKLKKNDYIKNFSEFKLLPGVAKGIKLLNNKNYIVIIATNQAGIGKSIISEKKKEIDTWGKSLYGTTEIAKEENLLEELAKLVIFRRIII